MSHIEGNTPEEKEFIAKHCTLHVHGVEKKIESMISGSTSTGSADYYMWIFKLLNTPISDGRHRIVWLVLCPFYMNILKVSKGAARDAITGYLTDCCKIKDTDAMNQIDYYLDYARSTGLKPMSLERFQEKFPEIAKLL